MRKLLTLVTFFLVCQSAMSQGFSNSNAWRIYKNEFTFGIGASNFLGDLGGRDMIGSDFIYDLEISKTNPAAYIGWRTRTSKHTAIRFSGQWGIIAGDDKLTAEPFRMNRNLNFKSPVIELSAMFEYHIALETPGNRYNLRNKAGKRIGLRGGGGGWYLFTGVAVTYFNPKGYTGSKWVNLYDLHTEGQGLEDGPDQYSRFTAAFPLGGGWRKSWNREWSIGLELGYRFTVTDYMDDVSGAYYNNSAIEAAYGPLAAQMADPNLGMDIGAPDIRPTDPGQQRGDITDKDGYMFLQVCLHYKIKRKSRYSGSVKRRYKASF